MLKIIVMDLDKYLENVKKPTGGLKKFNVCQ
jgi:hypothetical protein